MFTRALAVTLAFVVTATLGFGGVAVKPAEANDTGKILAGLAAGALVYGILDEADKDYRRYDGYGHDRRGYYDGNRQSWKFDSDRRYRSDYQFERHQDYRQHRSNRRAYNHGWNNGYDRGHEVGYNRGYDRGYDHGYDRGYDHGWDNGYDYGRYGGGGCWGGWGY